MKRKSKIKSPHLRRVQEHQKTIGIHSMCKGKMCSERKDDETRLIFIKNTILRTFTSSFTYRV